MLWAWAPRLSALSHFTAVSKQSPNNSSSWRQAPGNGFLKFGGHKNTCSPCRANAREDLWDSSLSPYQLLGLSVSCTEEEVKAAFRSKVKLYHPDVYSGTGDPDLMMKRLIRAYELLLEETATNNNNRRRTTDPFVEPRGEPVLVFVNELYCIGRECPYSCVARAPKTFAFAQDTGRARALAVPGGDADSNINLAVGQCPRNCIHYVTPEQGDVLDSLLQGALMGLQPLDDVAFELDGLIARANFENGRDRSPRREAKNKDKFVDWF